MTRFWIGVALAITGCGATDRSSSQAVAIIPSNPAPPHASSMIASTSSPSDPPDAAAAPSPPPMLGYEPVSRPARVACVLASEKWTSPVSLALEPGRDSYVDVGPDTKADLTVGEGATSPDVFVSVRQGSLILEGLRVGAALEP